MFTTHLEAMEELSGHVGWGMLSLLSLLAFLLFTGTSQKVPYTSVWSPHICKCCQGDTSKLPGLEDSSISTVVPQDCLYLHTCKAVA